MQKLLSVVSPKAPATSSGLSAAPAQLESSNIVQCFTNDGKAQTTAPENLLVVSPYTSRPHLLDLTLLNHAQVLLAKALTILTPVVEPYASLPYISSFNWKAVFGLLVSSFRSYFIPTPPELRVA